jgi:hypothetical protein
MTSLNCSGCGKPSFNANSMNCSGCSSPAQYAAPKKELKQSLNCAGCGGAHLGNKLNKTV